jgi:hypothetical protein
MSPLFLEWRCIQTHSERSLVAAALLSFTWADTAVASGCRDDMLMAQAESDRHLGREFGGMLHGETGKRSLEQGFEVLQ